MIGNMLKQRMRGVLPGKKDPYDVFPALNQSLFIEERRFPQNSQTTILVSCVLAVSFLFWASIPAIEEKIQLSGHIIPSTKVISIQHIEGGVVDTIMIRDGDFVREGQVLLTLESKGILDELAQAFLTEVSLKIRSERLRAFALEQPPNFDAFSQKHQNLVTDQLLIYEMQIKNWESQKNIIEKQQEQQKALLAVQLSQERILRERLAAGNTSKNRNELDQLLTQIHKTRRSISEFNYRLSALGAQLRTDAIREMDNIAAEIVQVKETITELQNRVNRSEVKAPLSGTVKELKVIPLKGALAPGAEIMKIYPEDAWEVEAHISPQEIKNIKVGQLVTLIISAFDDSRYGRIIGKIKSLSNLPFLDSTKKPNFKVYIAFKLPYVAKSGYTHKLASGMDIQVDVHTGKKSVIQYLIQPIYNRIEKSLMLK